MKNRIVHVYLLGFLFLSVIACKKEEEARPNPNPLVQDIYVIDKVYDYRQNLIAEYLYDSSNRVIQRKSQDPINNSSSDYFFEYDQDKLVNIKYDDHNFPQFNHDIRLNYDVAGRLISQETIQYARVISKIIYQYDIQNRVVSFYNDSNLHYYFFYYNDKGDIAYSMHVMDVSNNPFYQGKDTIQLYRYFKYDAQLKPEVMQTHLFQMEILPYFGTEATEERALSAHNMTEFVNGTKWIYTYNEQGLPATIETIWKDVVTEEPMMLRMVYRKL
jgi:hypothetical protein